MSSPTSTVAPSPVAPAGIPTCEFAQFVTDARWIVRRGKVAGTDSIWGDAALLPGRDLSALLCAVNPAWATLLPARAADCRDAVFLPLPSVQAPAFGFVLNRMDLEGGLFVFTLSPDLAPAGTLGDEGFAGVPLRPDSFARLFLRHRMLETRMQSYLENFPGVVFSRRSDLSFSFLSPRVEELTGLPAALLSKDGQLFDALVHESDRESYARESAAHATSQRTFSLTYRIQHSRTGQVHHIMDIRSPLRSASGLNLGCDGLWLDITRQKVAELRLNESGWKETLAVLTSGLLHDFGNLLSGIYSLSELYHAQVSPHAPMSEGLGMIKEHARQAQVLVKKISSLNRDTVGRRSYYSLNRLTREQLELIGPVLPRGIKIHTDFPEEEIPVYLDEVAFRQAMVNFALNARDAMGQQGEITIRLSAATVPADLADVVFAAPPCWAAPQTVLFFRDSGCGIPADKLCKIFDPFFTTKQSDRGTGLGLYTARLFAENEGGAIGVRSRLGASTEIVLVLPVANLSDVLTPLGLPETSPAVAEPPAPRRACILLHTPGQVPGAGLEDAIRARDWEVRNTIAFEELRLFLAEKGAGLDLLFVSQPETDETLPLLIELVRSEHPSLRIALEVTGQNPDEVPSEIRRRVDLLLRPNRPERDIVAELARILPAR